MQRRFEWFSLWHQWRCAIWFARQHAADNGQEIIKHSCLRDTARGVTWTAKLRMQEVTAQIMGDYHRDRMKHFRLLLGP